MDGISWSLDDALCFADLLNGEAFIYRHFSQRFSILFMVL